MIKSLGNIQNNIEIKIYNYKNILYNLQKVLKNKYILKNLIS